MRTSLIIPAYNEEKALPLVIEEYKDKVDEIIVVDDGSSDNTYNIAKKYDIKVYKHEKNQGKVAALHSGVKNSNGEIIIFTDADYTYPAKYVPQFIAEIEKDADLVLGSRFLNGINNMPILNTVGNMMFSAIISYIICKNITDGQTGFRAFKRDLFSKLDVDAISLEYETKMTLRAGKSGYKIVEIPIEYRKRIGHSKLKPIQDGFKMFRGLVSVAWKETSLIVKTIIIPSMLFIIIGLAFGIFSIYEKIEFGVLSNAYFPLITTIFIVVGIQFVSLGFIIDYMSRKLDRLEEKIRR